MPSSDDTGTLGRDTPVEELKVINVGKGRSSIGREPRYHLAIEELQDWAHAGKRLVPLKGDPGVVWERPKSRGCLLAA